MAKRTRNGSLDPYISRRVGSSQSKAHRQTVMPIRGNKAGIRDDKETAKAISEIGRQAMEKERSLASASGPHSQPPDPHYEKSFRVPLRGEEE